MVDSEWPDVLRHDELPKPYVRAVREQGGEWNIDLRLMDPLSPLQEGGEAAVLNTAQYTLTEKALVLHGLKSNVHSFESPKYGQPSEYSTRAVFTGLFDAIQVLRRGYRNGMHPFWTVR
jgi:hypothetical protein